MRRLAVAIVLLLYDGLITGCDAIAFHYRDDPSATNDLKRALDQSKSRVGTSKVEKALGVSNNKAGDLSVFTTTLWTNGLLVFIFYAVFSSLRTRFPQMYSNNARKKRDGGFDTAPFVPEDTYFGWVRAGLFVTVEEARVTSGTDSAMLLEFCQLGMRLTAWIGLPLMVILMPLHVIFGGGWKVTCNSRLTLVGLGNLPYGSPIFYVHAVVVWYVVVVAEWMVSRAMRNFLDIRFKWLKDLEPPQSTTVLVENIPDEHCSDLALTKFFSQMFPGKVERAEVVKYTTALKPLYQEFKTKLDDLNRVQHRIRRKEEQLFPSASFRGCASMPVGFTNRESPQATPENTELFPNQSSKDVLHSGKSFKESQDSILDEAMSCFAPKQDCSDEEMVHQLTGELEELEQKMQQERQRITAEANLPMVEGPDKTLTMDERARAIYARAGFVTFAGQREALLALNTTISADCNEYVMSIPPQPSDIIYNDLRVPPTKKHAMTAIGYVCILLVFCFFTPMVVTISAFVELENIEWKFRLLRRFLVAYPYTRPFLRGVLATLTLMIFLSFLPTALMAVFRIFYTLRARAWLQQELQKYYFWGLVLFILLVTTFGTEIIMPALKVGITPLKLAPMLANSLPHASHFYLNYAMTQWVAHSLDMVRWVQFLKYLYFRRSYSDRRAVAFAEPEDQDYYGIGARSARWTLDLVVGLVFCSVSPLINMLTFIAMFQSRINYGYLSVFAETRKPDLGGPFFVQQLWHVQFGIFLYALLMCGILLMRAKSVYPVVIALPALFYCVFRMIRFRDHFQWQNLPFKVLCTDEALARSQEKMAAYEAKQDRPVYEPPELCVHLDAGGGTFSYSPGRDLPRRADGLADIPQTRATSSSEAVHRVLSPPRKQSV